MNQKRNLARSPELGLSPASPLGWPGPATLVAELEGPSSPNDQSCRTMAILCNMELI